MHTHIDGVRDTSLTLQQTWQKREHRDEGPGQAQRHRLDTEQREHEI